MKLRLTQGFSFLAVLLTVSLLSVPCKAQDTISAKIGIKIKNASTERPALTEDRLKKGDMLQLYVMPAEEYFLYVVNCDDNFAYLRVSKKVKNQKNIIIPSGNEFFTVDGESKREAIIVICSEQRKPDLEKMFRPGKINLADWNLVEKKYIEQSKLIESEKVDKRILLGGNVRANDSFPKKLKTYYGKEFLVKTFRFDVKK